MEPVHVFHSFILLGYGLDMMSYLPFFITCRIGCKLGQISIIFAKVSFAVDIILSQVDRFIALYLNIRYNDIMTTRRALDICLTRFINIITKWD